MVYLLGLIVLTLCNICSAATPIDGVYSSAYGGFNYTPPNISRYYANEKMNSVGYQNGFDVGGAMGYKSNPMRYEVELSYLKANIAHFYLNDQLQKKPSGYNQAVFGMLNVLYDVPMMNPLLDPFLGLGMGYGWIQSRFSSQGPSDLITFNAEDSTFAYQGMAGLSYNFAENYAINLWYRYVGTTRLSNFGQIFQAHTANAGVSYRFDGNNYK